jgi:hypothetical protein
LSNIRVASALMLCSARSSNPPHSRVSVPSLQSVHSGFYFDNVSQLAKHDKDWGIKTRPLQHRRKSPLNQECLLDFLM